MATEQQLVESIRALAADDIETRGRAGGIAEDVFRGVRTHRRRRVIVGSAAAVAVVSLASYVGIHAVANTAATPATGQNTSDDGGQPGHTVLPAEVLGLRGEAVAAALNLPRITDPSADCPGTIAASSPSDSFCVDLGNAPDDWLVSELIMDSNRTSGPLRSVGIPWDSSLPAPPPVVVELIEAKLAQIEASFGQDSPQYHRAKVNLDLARALWQDEAGWEAAGWNDNYWGDPWWPTGESDQAPSQEYGHSVLPPEILDLRGAAAAEAVGLAAVGVDPVTGAYEQEKCPPPYRVGGHMVETGDGRAWCVAVGNEPDDWLVSVLVWNHPDSGERLLERVGVDWPSQLPPPPPVVIDLMTTHLAEVEGQFGTDSRQYIDARLWLNDANRMWENKAAWDAAGWNDHYWGEPWWPTNG